jgi:hypothetical protein
VNCAGFFGANPKPAKSKFIRRPLENDRHELKICCAIPECWRRDWPVKMRNNRALSLDPIHLGGGILSCLISPFHDERNQVLFAPNLTAI